jgi:hypothetical protein
MKHTTKPAKGARRVSPFTILFDHFIKLHQKLIKFRPDTHLTTSPLAGLHKGSACAVNFLFASVWTGAVPFLLRWCVRVL